MDFKTSITTTGSVSASQFIGDGSLLTGVALGSVPIPSPSPMGALARGYVFDSTIEGWVSGVSLTINSGRLEVAAGAGSNVTATEPLSSDVITDGEVEADLWVVSGTSAGILIRCSDARDAYYAAVVTNAAGTTPGCFLAKLYAGNYTVLAGVSSGMVSSGSVRVHVLIRVIGTVLEMYINGTCVATATDASIASGRAGVIAVDGTAQFSNLLVYNSPDRTKKIGGAEAPVVMNGGDISGSASLSTTGKHVIRCRLVGNTSLTLTGGADWQPINLIVEQDGTGGRTLAISDLNLAEGVSSLDYATAANKYTIIGLIKSPYGGWDLAAVQKGFSTV